MLLAIAPWSGSFLDGFLQGVGGASCLSPMTDPSAWRAPEMRNAQTFGNVDASSGDALDGTMSTDGGGQEGAARLSYKFQRLRERLRLAITTGELSGKLPGERQLAKRFRANAKTLSKALTDLAGEGLLDRSIGRGTYVRGSDGAATDAATSVRRRWLVACDAPEAGNPVLGSLRLMNPDIKLIEDLGALRPSALATCDGVVVFSRTVGDEVVRDLLVRGKTVVLVDREPAVYSTHAVLIDRALGASMIARELMLGGHRTIAVVEEAQDDQVFKAVRLCQPRYAPDAKIERSEVSGLAGWISRGVTAVLCASTDLAAAARTVIEGAHGRVGKTVALAAVGGGNDCGGAQSAGEIPCSGYFVPAARQAEAIAGLLTEKTHRRPLTMWLAGQWVDAGTMCAGVGEAGALRQRATA